MKPAVNLFWFRRDLRLDDNTGLYHALKDNNPVVPVFLFDRNILDELEDRSDPRVTFIHQALQDIQRDLLKKESTLDTRYGFPNEIFAELLIDYRIEKVYTNHDYEPYARKRDEEIGGILKQAGISFQTFKDHVIAEKNEVVKDNGQPYTVFTPYSVKWKTVVNEFYTRSYPNKKYAGNFFRQAAREVLPLASMNFHATAHQFPPQQWKEDIIKDYKNQRNIPSVQGTSRLSVHLRFGTVSIRKLAREAGSLSEMYLNELIWRDFYQMIIWHFPQVVVQAFKQDYDKIQWRNNEKEFDAWCKGETGYPIVDAGMRELNSTGFMHNRVRMIVASFLSKHLLIDWRWGEAYFAKKLLDFDLASNNGGWQWAAGSGCDAAPYFRIFNPYLQTKKFDPDLKYVRKWIPELEEFSYPPPVVNHELARKRCLEVYNSALKK